MRTEWKLRRFQVICGGAFHPIARYQELREVDCKTEAYLSISSNLRGFYWRSDATFFQIYIVPLCSLGSLFSLVSQIKSACTGLVDFAIGLENSVLKLPDEKVKFFEEFKLQKNCEINLLIKTLLGLVEMMLGLVNVRFSLPEWQAVEIAFFAPLLNNF